MEEQQPHTFIEGLQALLRANPRYDAVVAYVDAFKPASQAQQPKEELNHLELREFLECMQNGEMTVSRGLELIDLWLYGKYSNDMLPDYSEQPTLMDQLANAMQMHADMTAKYIALSKSQAQQSQWISVDERLPDSIREVIGAYWHEEIERFQPIFCCYDADDDDEWISYGDATPYPIRYWMESPLPPAPEGESNATNHK